MTLRSSPRKRGPRATNCGPWIPAGVHPRESGGGNERERGVPFPVPNPTAARALSWARTNGAATHVEGAHAACGGAGGVRGLERALRIASVWSAEAGSTT